MDSNKETMNMNKIIDYFESIKNIIMEFINGMHIMIIKKIYIYWYSVNKIKSLKCIVMHDANHFNPHQ